MRRAAIALLAISLVACASSSRAPQPASPSTGTPALSVEGTWASAEGARTALVYFLVSNPTPRPDVLVGASSEVGGRAVLQRATTAGGTRSVDRVTVAAGGQVAFQPGSYDVALVGMKRVPSSGSVVRLTLRFEHAGVIEVLAGVR
jgi:copper(I)-binding protein